MQSENTTYKRKIMELLKTASTRQLDIIYRFIRGLLYG